MKRRTFGIRYSRTASSATLENVLGEVLQRMRRARAHLRKNAVIQRGDARYASAANSHHSETSEYLESALSLFSRGAWCAMKADGDLCND